MNHTRGAFVMNQRVNQRAQELSNLKLALATFALRLDAFEARSKSRPTKTNAEPSKPGSPDIGLGCCANEKSPCLID
jgi:hypothetical protein